MTTVQVFEGGLPVPPVYDVPQYPNDGFDCETVGQLVDIVMRTGLVPVAEAREHWVVNGNMPTRERSLISVSLFNEHDEEIASYNPTMKRGLFHAKTTGRGRIWGKVIREVTQSLDITHLINTAIANFSS